jgi:hypothetical protein
LISRSVFVAGYVSASVNDDRFAHLCHGRHEEVEVELNHDVGEAAHACPDPSPWRHHFVLLVSFLGEDVSDHHLANALHCLVELHWNQDLPRPYQLFHWAPTSTHCPNP